jgi:hypothetical protein
LTVVNAAADVARIADKPTVAAMTCMKLPTATPPTEASATARPLLTLRFTM